MEHKQKTIEEILDEIFNPEVTREIDELINEARAIQDNLKGYMAKEHGVDLEVEMEKRGLDPKDIKLRKKIGL